MWYIGLFCGIATVVGLGYYCYSNFSISNWFHTDDRAAGLPAGYNYRFEDGHFVGQQPRGRFSVIGESIFNTLKAIPSYLNPYSYYIPNDVIERQRALFTEDQTNRDKVDFRYYPFTEIYPNTSWWDRLKLMIYGEDQDVKQARNDFANYCRRNMLVGAQADPGHSTNIGDVGLRAGRATPNWLNPTDTDIGVALGNQRAEYKVDQINKIKEPPRSTIFSADVEWCDALDHPAPGFRD